MARQNGPNKLHLAGWMEKIPGSTPSGPALHAISDDVVYLAVRGSNNRVYLNKWTGGWGWAGWTRPPTGTTPSPPSIADAGTQLYVVVRGTDDGIYKCSYSLPGGTWSSWTKLAGSTSNTPALA